MCVLPQIIFHIIWLKRVGYTTFYLSYLSSFSVFLAKIYIPVVTFFNIILSVLSSLIFLYYLQILFTHSKMGQWSLTFPGIWLFQVSIYFYYFTMNLLPLKSNWQYSLKIKDTKWWKNINIISIYFIFMSESLAHHLLTPQM